MLKQNKQQKQKYPPKNYLIKTSKLLTMKMTMLWIAVSAILLSSCKKDTTAPPVTPTTFADFLKTTEWVGTLDRSGYSYAPPCCLKVKADNKIAVYAPWYFNINGVISRPDSINGTITSIDSMPDGRTSVKVNFQFLNDVTLDITGRKTLTCISSNPGKPVPFQLELFTATGFLVKSTAWSGPAVSVPGYNGIAYPDVSGIHFQNNSTTWYKRNGQYVLAQPTPQIPTPGILEIAYRQYGAMLFMSGYNETNLTTMDYFGVLMPDASKMMVHSSAQGARLPYYTQTQPYYGPIGTTPVLNKL